MSWGLDLFDGLPELRAIGLPQVLVYVQEWIKTPLAREFSVMAIDVSEDFRFSPNIGLTHETEDGETVVVPFDEMLHYIVDRHFEDADQRQSLHERIHQRRREQGESGRIYTADLGPRYPLYLVCKNSGCQNLMQTQFTAHVGQQLGKDSANVTCPRCQHTYLYSTDELSFLSTPLS